MTFEEVPLTQGCICPACSNECWAPDYDGYVLCPRCFRAGCSKAQSSHRGPSCTMRDCTHQGHA